VRRWAGLLALVLALGAAAPAAEPAARQKCSKRTACKGKVRGQRAGMPSAWSKRSQRPGRNATPPRTQAPGTAPGSTPGTAPPPPPPPPPPPEDPRYLQVVARDSDPVQWQLQLSRPALLSGTVQVEFNNRFAEDPHDLWLKLGAKTYEFPTVQNGEAATRTLALTAGTWKLWCDIGGHEEQGMVAYVTVTDH
jgi:hypothetical protein